MVEDWSNNYFESILTLVKDDNLDLGKWSRAYVTSTYNDINNNKHLSSIMAAMFYNPDLLDDFRHRYDSLLNKLDDDGIDPVKATIARLSIDGLWFSEIFGMRPLRKDLQTQVFNELIDMVQGEE